MMTERYNFFRTFVLATEQSTYFEIPAEDSSAFFIADGSDKELDSCNFIKYKRPLCLSSYCRPFIAADNRF